MSLIATRKIPLHRAALPVVAALLWTASPARAAEPDGPAARALVSQAAHAAWAGGDFAQLEKTADDFRKNKARFPEGVWKLPVFYEGLGPKFGNNSKPDWKEWFSKLDAWKAAFPDSPTQPVVRAQTLVAYAWDARGYGFANTVTSEGWKLLAERLKQASAVLAEAERLPVRDPHWYNVMQQIALGEGWDHDRYEALFAKAVAAEPTYYTFYFSRVSAELPRWGGGPNAWLDFAEEAARKYDSGEGLSIYARIFWSHAGQVGGDFRNPRVDWKKVRQGFRDIEKQYPDSNWNLNNFCRFACLAGDRETAHELFGRLGDAVSLPTWGSRIAFEGWRRWADPTQSVSQLRADLVVPSDESLTAQSVAFSPDGQTLLAGYNDGQVRLWGLSTRKVVWSEDLRHGKVAAVAFSPDSKVFAAGTGDWTNNRTPGVVVLWETSKREIMTTLAERRGQVFALAFAPGGKTLAIAGGALGAQPFGEAAFYDLDAKTLVPQAWGDGRYLASSVAFSPDGQFLAASRGRSITCWNLAKQEFASDHHTHATHAATVQSVAISPDGKTLVTGSAPPSWAEPPKIGELRRWDLTAKGCPEITTPVWTPPPPGGVLATAFSPDGKWLAVGGRDGILQLWETATGKVAATLTGHHAPVGTLAFAPDGKTLASGAEDGTVKCWNVPAADTP